MLNRIGIYANDSKVGRTVDSAGLLYLCLIVLGFFNLLGLNSCKKAEGDPWLSLRSRDARLIGTWIYSDTINGNSRSHKIRINKNGTVDHISMTINGQWLKDTSGKIANWYWAHESKCKNKKSKLIFEYNDYFVREYNLISLRHDEVKIWYLKNIANPGMVSYMTMIRQ